MSSYDFIELCLPHRENLLNFARKLTGGDHARAEDVVQDSLVRAMTAWERWAPTNNMTPEISARAWLYRIVSHTFVNDYQHRVVAGRATRGYAQEYDLHSATPDTVHVEEVVDSEIQAALSQIDPVWREIFERYYLRDQGHQEIADALGVPVGTVSSRLSRTRSQLAPLLRKHARENYGMTVPRPTYSRAAIVRRRRQTAREDSDALEPPEMMETDTDGIDSIVAGDDGSDLDLGESTLDALSAH